MADLVRRLTLRGASGDTAIEVRLGEPQAGNGYWSCVTTIGWPEGAARREWRGADAVQALYMAMQGVALGLYASSYHREGRLYWTAPGQGYGFPMPKGARSELVGQDRNEQA